MGQSFGFPAHGYNQIIVFTDGEDFKNIVAANPNMTAIMGLTTTRNETSLGFTLLGLRPIYIRINRWPIVLPLKNIVGGLSMKLLCAEEVALKLGINIKAARLVIKKLNAELEDKGYLTVSRRIPEKYLEERYYG